MQGACQATEGRDAQPAAVSRDGGTCVGPASASASASGRKLAITSLAKRSPSGVGTTRPASRRSQPRACACASGAAIAHLVGADALPGRALVTLDGGELTVEVSDTLEVNLTGWARPVFAGRLSDEFEKELHETE